MLVVKYKKLFIFVRKTLNKSRKRRQRQFLQFEKTNNEEPIHKTVYCQPRHTS